MKPWPSWFRTWENSGLIAWYDHNHDGKIQHAAGRAFAGGKPVFDRDARGESGRRLVTNPGPGDVAEGAPFANEVYVDRDIMVLANPEIAGLPDWVIALIAAGGIAAALSTAAGLLLVISVAVSHDILKSTFAKNLSDKQELTAGRIAAAVSIAIAGYLGIQSPGLRGPGGGVRLRTGRLVPVPGHPAGHLQHTHEQMGCHCRYADGSHLYHGIYYLFQRRCLSPPWRRTSRPTGFSEFRRKASARSACS